MRSLFIVLSFAFAGNSIVVGMEQQVVVRIILAPTVSGVDLPEYVDLDETLKEKLKKIVGVDFKARLDLAEPIKLEKVTRFAFDFIVAHALKGRQGMVNPLRKILSQTERYSELLDAAQELQVEAVFEAHEQVYIYALDAWGEDEIKEQEWLSAISEYNAKHSGTLASRRWGAPLLVAVIHSGNEMLVAKTIKRINNIDEQDEDGLTFLMFAVERGIYDIVQQLVKAGVNCLLTDKRGQTALMRAENHLAQLSHTYSGRAEGAVVIQQYKRIVELLTSFN